MTVLPDEPVPTRLAPDAVVASPGMAQASPSMSQASPSLSQAPLPVVPEEPRPPGRVAQTYWFVLVGGVLALGLFGCYFAILYGHWHPISFSSHYPAT